MFRNVEVRNSRYDVAVISHGAAARAQADAADRAAAGRDCCNGLGREIVVMNQYSCVEPVERLPQPLRCFAHMQAAGNVSAQGSCEPRDSMPRGAAAQIGDHSARRGAIFAKGPSDPQRLIERVSAGDAIDVVDEQLVAPAPLRRADEQIAQGFDERRAEHAESTEG
jgi:hypothetical protein